MHQLSRLRLFGYGTFDHRDAPYFAFVLIASIPPLLLAWFAPFPHGEREDPAT